MAVCGLNFVDETKDEDTFLKKGKHFVMDHSLKNVLQNPVTACSKEGLLLTEGNEKVDRRIMINYKKVEFQYTSFASLCQIKINSNGVEYVGSGAKVAFNERG